MPELFGSVQRIELSATLWLLPLLPLLAALANALAGLRNPRPETARRVVEVSFGALLSAFLLGVWHTAHLFELAEPLRHLHWHGWQMARVGSISFDFGLALDPLSATLILMLTAAGAFTHLRLAKRGKHRLRTFGSLHLALGSLLVLALADGFIPLFFGWQGLAFASFLLFTDGDSGGARWVEKAFVAQRIGDIGFLLAMTVLLWGLGGRWLPDGIYQPDLNPHFVAITNKGESAPESELSGRLATLSFTAFPGARLDIDNAPLGLSPIVDHPVEPGRHSFVIAKSHAGEAHEINWLVMNANSETTILPVGPTLVFRHIRDQLGLHDEQGRHVVWQSFATKRIFGTTLLTLACLFYCLPILAQAPIVAASLYREQDGRRRIAAPGVLAMLGCSCLLLRGWFLFSMTQRTTEIMAALLGVFVTAVVITIRTARPRHIQR